MVGAPRACSSRRNKSSAKPGQANSLSEDQSNIQRSQSTNWDIVPNFSLVSVLLQQAWPGTIRMPQTRCPGAQKSATEPRHLSWEGKNVPLALSKPSHPAPATAPRAGSILGSGKCHQKGWKSGSSFQQTHWTTKQCKGISEPPHSMEVLFSHSFQNSHLSSPPGLSPDVRWSCSSLQTLGSVSFLHGQLRGITTASLNSSTQGTLEHSGQGAAHIPDFISRECFIETPQFV